MILDKNIETIGAPRDYQKVSQTIIAESFPSRTDATLYQPLIDRIPTWNATVLREALDSMSRFNVHGQLLQIHVPTLIMVGVKDDVATTAIAKGIHEQIPDSRLAEFQTGHFIMAEDPDAYQTSSDNFSKSSKRERGKVSGTKQSKRGMNSAIVGGLAEVYPKCNRSASAHRRELETDGSTTEAHRVGQM